MLRRQDFVCYRCLNWKGEDSDEPVDSLHDTFGIHSKGMKPKGVSLKQTKENVTKIDDYAKDTVSKVKEHYQLSESDCCNQWSTGSCIKEDVSFCVFASKGYGQAIQERKVVGDA